MNMPELESRGYSLKFGCWIYGFYFYSEKENKHYIMGESKDYGFQKIEIEDSNTIGQFTGFKDKNNNRIFGKCNVKYHEDVYTIHWDSTLGCWILNEEELLGEANFAFIEVIDDSPGKITIAGKEVLKALHKSLFEEELSYKVQHARLKIIDLNDTDIRFKYFDR